MKKRLKVGKLIISHLEDLIFGVAILETSFAKVFDRRCSGGVATPKGGESRVVVESTVGVNTGRAPSHCG